MTLKKFYAFRHQYQVQYSAKVEALFAKALLSEHNGDYDQAENYLNKAIAAID